MGTGMSGVRDWPPIEDPRVLEWLALDHDAWRAALGERIRAVGPRAYGTAELERALAYPWERPPGSYVLRHGQVELLEEIEPSERRAVVSSFARDRHPLV